ncbi:MAG: class I SAM-dependent methyltransferase [Verrucomicrobiota bacterium]
MTFGSNYSDYWKNRITSNVGGSIPPDQQTLAHFLPLLEIGKTDLTLDLGCSFGRFYNLLSEYSNNIVGLDIDPSAIEQCRPLGYKQLEACKFEENSLPDASVDKAVCWAVFDCLDQEKALLECNRILKNGGRILITGKNDNYLATDHEAFVAERNARLKSFPNHFTDLEALHQLAPTLGFKIISVFCYEKRGDFGINKYVAYDPGNPQPFYEYLIILEKSGPSLASSDFKICDTVSRTARIKALAANLDDPLEYFRWDAKLETRKDKSLKPTVHIVHHVDTEGPLHEPIGELFLRIEATLGQPLNLDPTPENLKILQSKEYVFMNEEIDRSLKTMIDPELLQFKKNWDEVGEMLDRILHPSFRNKYSDSFGNGWIYNWHIIDHVGFEHNRRSKALGYQTVFNYYLDKLAATDSHQDSLQWHFHPVPFNKEVHLCATSYLNSYHELSQVVARRLIDNNWFPVVNRAGFHTVRPDSNWWLEQWLPFDASNQAIEEAENTFADTANGRYGDWRGAPSDWSIYHPDLYDWRKKGPLKRSISRCLNMKTRFRNITVAEFEKAFARARDTQEDVYVGFTNHDFREMSTEIEETYQSLSKAAEKFPDVTFRFSGAVDAFRACLNYSDMEVKANSVALAAEVDGSTLRVRITKGTFFGSQPFLALKTRAQTYHTDNFDFGPVDSQEFYYTFDISTFELRDLEAIAVAANDCYGNTSIARIEL